MLKSPNMQNKCRPNSLNIVINNHNLIIYITNTQIVSLGIMRFRTYTRYQTHVTLKNKSILREFYPIHSRRLWYMMPEWLYVQSYSVCIIISLQILHFFLYFKNIIKINNSHK